MGCSGSAEREGKSGSSSRPSSTPTPTPHSPYSPSPDHSPTQGTRHASPQRLTTVSPNTAARLLHRIASTRESMEVEPRQTSVGAGANAPPPPPYALGNKAHAVSRPHVSASNDVADPSDVVVGVEADAPMTPSTPSTSVGAHALSSPGCAGHPQLSMLRPADEAVLSPRGAVATPRDAAPHRGQRRVLSSAAAIARAKAGAPSLVAGDSESSAARADNAVVPETPSRQNTPRTGRSAAAQVHKPVLDWKRSDDSMLSRTGSGREKDSSKSRARVPAKSRAARDVNASSKTSRVRSKTTPPVLQKVPPPLAAADVLMEAEPAAYARDDSGLGALEAAVVADTAAASEELPCVTGEGDDSDAEEDEPDKIPAEVHWSEVRRQLRLVRKAIKIRQPQSKPPTPTPEPPSCGKPRRGGTSVPTTPKALQSAYSSPASAPAPPPVVVEGNLLSVNLGTDGKRESPKTGPACTDVSPEATADNGAGDVSAAGYADVPKHNSSGSDQGVVLFTDTTVVDAVQDNDVPAAALAGAPGGSTEDTEAKTGGDDSGTAAPAGSPDGSSACSMPPAPDGGLPADRNITAGMDASVQDAPASESVATTPLPQSSLDASESSAAVTTPHPTTPISPGAKVGRVRPAVVFADSAAPKEHESRPPSTPATPQRHTGTVQFAPMSPRRGSLSSRRAAQTPSSRLRSPTVKGTPVSPGPDSRRNSESSSIGMRDQAFSAAGSPLGGGFVVGHWGKIDPLGTQTPFMPLPSAPPVKHDFEVSLDGALGVGIEGRMVVYTSAGAEDAPCNPNGKPGAEDGAVVDLEDGIFLEAPTSRQGVAEGLEGLEPGMVISHLDDTVMDVLETEPCRAYIAMQRDFVRAGDRDPVMKVTAYRLSERHSKDLYPSSCTQQAHVLRGVRAAQSILSTYFYTTEGSTFNVEKKRPLGALYDTASQILRDGVYIQCVEGTFLGLLLTHWLQPLTRFGLSFESRTPEGTIYKHLVLGLRYGRRYGALGISRNKGLMTKDMAFASLSELVADFIQYYNQEGHVVRRVVVSRPIHRFLNQRPEWRAARFQLTEVTWLDFERKLKLFESSWLTEPQLGPGVARVPVRRRNFNKAPAAEAMV